MEEVATKRRTTTAGGAGWGSLPLDLLLLILGRLSYFSDYVRFVSVSRQWRLAGEYKLDDDQHAANKTKLRILRTCHNKLPLLMLRPETVAENSSLLVITTSNCGDLGPLPNGSVYDIELPLRDENWTGGSSLGWLLMNDESTEAVSLINPFTRGRISGIPKLVGGAVIKFILSSNVPFRDPFEVVAIYRTQEQRRLACFRWDDDDHPEERHWKLLRDKYYEFHDIVYHKGRVYAIAVRNKDDRAPWDTALFEVNFDDSSTRLVVKTGGGCPDIAYLAVSEEGQLLMVQQFLGQALRTCFFKVFVLLEEEEEEEMTWHEIDDLGQRALFVGNNQSVFVSTLEFSSCHPNCIYYTDYRYAVLDGLGALHFDIKGNQNLDIGVFNLGFKTIQSPCVFQPGMMLVFPPMWVVPNLKDSEEVEEEPISGPHDP